MAEYHPSAKQIAEAEERKVLAVVRAALMRKQQEAARIAGVISAARSASKYMPHQGRRECARRLARA